MTVENYSLKKMEARFILQIAADMSDSVKMSREYPESDYDGFLDSFLFLNTFLSI